MSALELITPPATEPVTLDEAKQHLRVDTDADDNLISALITVARQSAEAKTGRALMPQTWKLSLSAFPQYCNPHHYSSLRNGMSRRIKLPRPPFAGIVSVAYVDRAGVAQTLDNAAYVIGRENMAATLRPAYNTVWPTTRDDDNVVNVTFSAGYASAAEVPEPIKAWMKIMIGTLYENREAVLHGLTAAASFMPRGFADGLLDPYLVPAVA